MAAFRACQPETLSGTSSASDDIPTIQETLLGFRFQGWFAVVAPRSVPSEIVYRFSREIGKFLKGDAAVQRLRSLGFTPAPFSTPETTAQFLRSERGHWRKIVEELGIKPQ